MTDTPTPDLTGRLRTDVRVIDVLAADLLHNGTAYERVAAEMLTLTATLIVNGDLWWALMALDRYDKPRAGGEATARQAAMVEADKAEGSEA